MKKRLRQRRPRERPVLVRYGRKLFGDEEVIETLMRVMATSASSPSRKLFADEMKKQIATSVTWHPTLRIPCLSIWPTDDRPPPGARSDFVGQRRVRGDPRGPGGPPHRFWRGCYFARFLDLVCNRIGVPMKPNFLRIWLTRCARSSAS